MNLHQSKEVLAQCEAVGMFGLLARVVTGPPYFYLFFALAILDF